MSNNNINLLKSKIDSAVHNDTSTKIISIVCAVVIWLAISISVYPVISDVIYNVPIKIDTEGTFAAVNSLQAELADELSANVYIKGERSQVGGLDAADILLNVDTSRISAPGEYNLPLEVVNNSGKEFEVEKISPSSVMVKIERIVTKEFTVTAVIDSSSITVADGYMTKEPIFVSANSISVTGPEEQVSSITDAKVTISSAEPITLSSSYEFNSSEIALYNNGVRISNSDGNLTLSRSNFTVQIPVFVRQTLPLEVSIVNAPDGFNVDYFKNQLVMSTEELDIAAPTDKIKDIKSINIGTINMREVDIGSTFTYNMENVLPEGYENLSGLSSVTVKCPSENLSKRLVAVRERNIQIINAPSQFEFEFITSTIMPYFVGPSNTIENLTSTDISCQIDILNSDFDNTEGEYIMPTTFAINNSDKVWINAGSASLNVYVKAVKKAPESFEEE